jgi:FtsP/CotA-like multicopper oxidase with cupredoxin domain
VFAGNLGSHAEALLRFDLEDGTVADDTYIPEQLGILTDKQAMENRSTGTRSYRFVRGIDWTINGKTWNRASVDGNPNQCATEVWTLSNAGGWTHPVHIHLVDFQILERNGQEPFPYERGWKDVVLLKDFETVKVVARFGPHRGKYMIHCHNIVHEDHDMMTQFEVGKGGIDPLSDPAKPLSTAPPLGSKEPPNLLEDCLPCQCFESLSNSCPTT